MDDNLRQLLGKHTRALRESLSMSQKAFGRHADMHRTRVGQIEREEANTCVDTIGRMATALGVKPLDLLCSERFARAFPDAAKLL